MRVLAREAHALPHLRLRGLADVLSADRDRAGLRVQEAHEQPGERRLAGAARSDDRDARARLDAERDAVEGGNIAAGEPHGDRVGEQRT